MRKAQAALRPLLPAILALALLASVLATTYHALPAETKAEAAAPFEVAGYAVEWCDKRWMFPHVVVDAISNETKTVFESEFLSSCSIASDEELPYGHLMWLKGYISLNCCLLDLRLRVECVSDFKLSVSFYISATPLDGWEVGAVRFYLMPCLDCLSIYLPHVVNVSFSPDMPRKRIMLVNTPLCGLAADNYVIMREKDGPLWVLASSRRPLMITGRVEEGFFSRPSLWFSLDREALGERPSLSLTIFRLPREAGVSPERLLRAAADLAHEALCLCNCSIVERTRHHDYWLMRLRYVFSA